MGTALAIGRWENCNGGRDGPPPPAKSGRNDRRSRAASGPKSIWLNGSKWADGKRKMGLAVRRRLWPGSLPRYGWQRLSRDIDHFDIRWAGRQHDLARSPDGSHVE